MTAELIDWADVPQDVKDELATRDDRRKPGNLAIVDRVVGAELETVDGPVRARAYRYYATRNAFGGWSPIKVDREFGQPEEAPSDLTPEQREEHRRQVDKVEEAMKRREAAAQTQSGPDVTAVGDDVEFTEDGVSISWVTEKSHGVAPQTPVWTPIGETVYGAPIEPSRQRSRGTTVPIEVGFMSDDVHELHDVVSVLDRRGLPMRVRIHEIEVYPNTPRRRYAGTVIQ